MIECGKKKLSFEEDNPLCLPDLKDIRDHMTLFLPFILSFLLLMEHLYIVNKQQEANFLWVGILAILFSAATVATYCRPMFRQRFLATVPVTSIFIGFLMLWDLGAAFY